MEEKEQRSRIMKAIKSEGTKDEVRLAKALWKKGFRYRKNNKTVFGCPDITFKQQKIAIFIDGEFFHGYNWEEKREKIRSNREYWIPKIERNMLRDKKVNEKLISQGWVVIRFWSSFVKKNLEACIKIVENELSIKEKQNTK